jgi:autoinducer 2-degrading protein
MIGMAEKVVLSGFITVLAGEVERVLELLPEHIALTLAEPGCLVFEVRQRAGTPTIFDVYEEFQTAEAFAAHQARVQASPWGAVTKGVERSYTVKGI